jgi:Zn-dependent protease with chaperone function
LAAARATLDFFAAQEAARRRTALLVVWFALALLGTCAVIWAGLGGVLGLSSSPAARRLAFGPELALAVAALVASVTAIGAAVHHARLARGGGEAVATMLGGVAVDRRSEDPAERRLVNVVEEMAIAAGLPVPALFVLPAEPGINAFAAGFSPERSVVALTRGALDALTRDELQGVVAHELSHVLNGDARLNLRLLALIGGITVLASVGRLLARLSRSGSRWRSRRSGGGAIVLAGLCIWVAGAVGAFFGRVIRAAVSRQREYLADAAAVQFTRNPGGLAGALAKIQAAGSALESAFAPEAAHLFFANGLASQWLATHPPVEERIRRLVPLGLAAGAAPAPRPSPPEGEREGPAAGVAASTGRREREDRAAGLVASAGRPGPDHLAQAARTLAALPPEVVAAAREPASAAALVRALLADPEPAVRAVQLRALADGALRAEVERLAAALRPAGRGERMAALDLALPALDDLPRGAAAPFAAELAALARADGKTTLFEWAVLRVAGRRLARASPARPAPVTAHVLEDVQVDALDLLSALAWAGAGDGVAAQAALEAALAPLGASGWRVLPRDRIGGGRLEAALARLEGASPALKARLLAACAAAVLADGSVRPAEGELVRAVAASLGVPLPPLVAPGAAGAAVGAA